MQSRRRPCFAYWRLRGKGSPAFVGGPAHEQPSVGPAHHSISLVFRRNPVGKRKDGHFVGFERDFLGEHDIAGRQSAFGNETPAGLRLSGFIDLHNITQGTIVNSISAAGVRASDFEITFGIELRALIGRQPFAQKTTRPRFRSTFFEEATIKRTQGMQTRPVTDAAPSE